MSRSIKPFSAKCVKFLCMVIAITALTACGSSMPRSPTPSPLVVANCPDSLGPLRDDTFGATTEKLSDVAATYYRCRTAAMAGYTP